MKQPSKTLTGEVLSAAYGVRRSYHAHRVMTDTQGQYLSALLLSYGDISEDQAQLWISGRRRPSLPLIRHYAAAAQCPKRLYDDIRSYYVTPAISSTHMEVLWHNLCDMLYQLPSADRDDIKCIVDRYDGAAARTCALLTCLLQYAWHMDIARYTYVMA